MDRLLVLKAVADETRMKLLSMLLKNNCCVRALARRLESTEANISKHLKTLQKAGLISGKKRGYFMRYDVERSVLRELAAEFEVLASIKRMPCTPEQSGCQHSEQENCHIKCECSDEIKSLCHGSV